MQLQIQKFRDKIDALLEKSKIQLEHDFSNVIFSFYRPENSFTVCLSAFFKNSPPELPDLVEFEFIIDKQNSGEYQIEVDVIWGADGLGCFEGGFADNPIKIDEVVLERVYNDIPRLLSVFRTAIQRRVPYDWEERKKLRR